MSCLPAIRVHSVLVGPMTMMPAALDDAGKLWVHHPDMGVSRWILPMHQREGIMKEALKRLGFPNSQSLAAALQGSVFWEGM